MVQRSWRADEHDARGKARPSGLPVPSGGLPAFHVPGIRPSQPLLSKNCPASSSDFKGLTPPEVFRR